MVNDNLEEGDDFYVIDFQNSKIVSVNRSGDAGGSERNRDGRDVPNSDGQRFLALMRPHFTFTPAISMFVTVRRRMNRRVWEKLSAGGENRDAVGSKTNRFVMAKRSFAWAICCKIKILSESKKHSKRSCRMGKARHRKTAAGARPG